MHNFLNLKNATLRSREGLTFFLLLTMLLFCKRVYRKIELQRVCYLYNKINDLMHINLIKNIGC